MLGIFKSLGQLKKNGKNESWNFKLEVSAILVNFAWKIKTN